jgi:N-acetylglucosamine-6-phosphate deacetylase
MRQAFAWGVSQVTHAFNAMPPLHHRRPGLLTEALKNPAIRLELIADGVHIHPAVLELVLSIKPEPSVMLVSDGTRAVGMPDGDYDLGGQMTTVKNGIATLSDGTIAGSAYPLLQGVKTLVVIGFDLPRAIRHASLYPAKLLGVDHRLGSIALGREATLIQLDNDLNIKQIWRKGIKSV